MAPADVRTAASLVALLAVLITCAVVVGVTDSAPSSPAVEIDVDRPQKVSTVPKPLTKSPARSR